MERKWWTLLTVCVATFMLLLDITVVNTALPSIERDLGASFAELQWVIDAYALTLAAFVLTAGSLADRLGRRLVFAWGLVVFSIASLLAGLAPDPTLLNLARGLQGIGAAVMFAVSLALIAQDFRPGRERGMAMGAFGASIGVAIAVGPLIGGALTEALGWEWIFFVNVPIGALVLAATALRLAESKDPSPAGIDWAGLVTFTAALFMLVAALLRGNQEGWGSPEIVSLLAGAAASMAAFVMVERRAADPMLPLELFRRPAFTGVQLGAFAVSSSMFALYLYLTLYLQNHLGLSPLEAGTRYLPFTIITFLVSMLTGALLSRVQARLLISAGLAATGAGMLLMAGLEVDSTWTALLAGFMLAGAGVGLLNPAISDVALSVVPRARSGMAAGINDAFRQVGVAVGIAAWGAILLGRGSNRTEELAAGTPGADGDRPRELVEAASSGGLDSAVAALPPGDRGQLTDAASEGFLAGLNDVLVLGAAVAFVGAVLVLWLVREEQIEREPVPAVAEPAA
jgi:EmrB/QacA subfamily drug resistance transporter